MFNRIKLIESLTRCLFMNLLYVIVNLIFGLYLLFYHNWFEKYFLNHKSTSYRQVMCFFISFGILPSDIGCGFFSFGKENQFRKLIEKNIEWNYCSLSIFNLKYQFDIECCLLVIWPMLLLPHVLMILYQYKHT